MLMATKRDTLVTYHQGLSPIKLYDTLFTWSYKIMRWTKTIISPLPQCLRQPDLVWCWITLRGSDPFLDLHPTYYENTILLGDFNVSIDDPHMESFYELYRFKNLTKDPTCFTNPENPPCIDLILANSPYSFQNSCVIETGPSDFHKMIVSVMKITFQKLKPIETVIDFLMIILEKKFWKIYL